MTHVEKALREMMHDAEADTIHGEPQVLGIHTRDSLEEFSTYWYDRGIKDACEKALNNLALDRQRDERISKAALSILDDLEVIGH